MGVRIGKTVGFWRTDPQQNMYIEGILKDMQKMSTHLWQKKSQPQISLEPYYTMMRDGRVVPTKFLLKNVLQRLPSLNFFLIWRQKKNILSFALIFLTGKNSKNIVSMNPSSRFSWWMNFSQLKMTRKCTRKKLARIIYWTAELEFNNCGNWGMRKDHKCYVLWQYKSDMIIYTYTYYNRRKS